MERRTRGILLFPSPACGGGRPRGGDSRARTGGGAGRRALSRLPRASRSEATLPLRKGVYARLRRAMRGRETRGPRGALLHADPARANDLAPFRRLTGVVGRELVRQASDNNDALPRERLARFGRLERGDQRRAD